MSQTALSFETLAPRWTNGQLIQKNDLLFFQRDNGEMVAIPPDLGAIAQLIDGHKNLVQLAKDLQARTHKVQIRKIISALKQFSQLGLLDNHQEINALLAPHHIANRKPLPRLFRPVWQKTFVAPSLTAPDTSLLAIFATGLLLCASAGLSRFWPETLPSDWLKYRDSYALGLAGLWLTHSLIASLNSSLQRTVLGLTTGFWSPLTLSLTLFHFGLERPTSERSKPLSLRQNLLTAALSTLSPVALLSLLIWGVPSPELKTHLAVLLPIYLLLHLNPYRESELTRFFQRLHRTDKEDHLYDDMLPFLKKKALIHAGTRNSQISSEKWLLTFATLATLWSFWCYDLLLHLTDANMPNLTVALTHATGPDRIAAAVILLLLIGMTLYMTYEILSTLCLNIWQPLLSPFYKVSKKWRTQDSSELSPAHLKNALRNTHLFSDISDAALDTVVQNSQLRKFRSQTRVLIQGTRGQEIFVLLDGQVRIEKRTDTGRVLALATLHSGAVLGESALMPNHQRSADVVTQGEALLLHIPCQVFEKAVDSTQLDRLLQHILISQYISMSDLFRHLPQEAATLLATEGVIETHPAHHIVLEQGHLGKEFYLLLRGSVEATRDGQFTARINEGSFFGEIALVADTPRTATIKTLEEVTLLKLNAESFWQVLYKNIGLAVSIESIADLRQSELPPSEVTS